MAKDSTELSVGFYSDIDEISEDIIEDIKDTVISLMDEMGIAATCDGYECEYQGEEPEGYSFIYFLYVSLIDDYSQCRQIVDLMTDTLEEYGYEPYDDYIEDWESGDDDY